MSTINCCFPPALLYLLLKTSSYTPAQIQTLMFAGLGITSLFYVFSCRSLRKNIWEYNPFSNLFLLASVALSFFFLVVVIYIPPLQQLFGTEPLTLKDWVLLTILGALNVVFIEFGKWIFIQRDRRKAGTIEM